MTLIFVSRYKQTAIIIGIVVVVIVVSPSNENGVFLEELLKYF
jgi:hypothetical protein